MADALVGFTGFVGSTLLKQRQFDHLYRSTTIGDAAGGQYGTLVCAGAPAQKWLANRDPAGDEANVRRLIAVLESVRCEQFILISTVDVFANPVGVDEDSATTDQDLHAYGRHRLMLERFVAEHFPKRLIVRLAGLVGPGLRKNAVYDLHRRHNLEALDPDAVYQFYPMVNLWSDVRRAVDHELQLVHLTAEPTSLEEIAREGFGVEIDRRPTRGAPPSYDMRSRFASLFGGPARYQYAKREVIGAVRAYAQSEPGGA